MKYYRMKIDKQGKTQKKQSKKNYRKTLKGGLMEFLRGKSYRGEVENIIHQLHLDWLDLLYMGITLMFGIVIMMSVVVMNYQMVQKIQQTLTIYSNIKTN